MIGHEVISSIFQQVSYIYPILSSCTVTCSKLCLSSFIFDFSFQVNCTLRWCVSVTNDLWERQAFSYNQQLHVRTSNINTEPQFNAILLPDNLLLFEITTGKHLAKFVEFCKN